MVTLIKPGTIVPCSLHRAAPRAAEVVGLAGLVVRRLLPEATPRSSLHQPASQSHSTITVSTSVRDAASSALGETIPRGVEVSLPGQMVPLFRTAALLSLIVLFPSAVQGEIARVCDISFQLPDGSWSTPERREVIFRTGREMNQSSTTYFSYDAQEEYAVVVWGQGDVTIIDLDAALLVDATGFSNDDFRRLFNVRSQLEAPAVNDGLRRRWRIVAKQGVPARFIDARADSPSH